MSNETHLNTWWRHQMEIVSAFRARLFPLPDGPGQVTLPVGQVDLDRFFFFISYKQIEEFQNSWSRASDDFEKRRALALLAICVGNSPVPSEFPAQRPVTRSFDVFFNLRLNKRLSKQSWGWWFETLSRPLWRHRNVEKLHSSLPITYQIFYSKLTHFCNEKPMSQVVI